MASLNSQLLVLALTVLILFSNLSIAKPTFTPVLPPSYPLAVRNPYLSAWLPGNQAANLPSAVAQFWNDQKLTWSVIARIDGQTYSLFGVPRPSDRIKPATVISADLTATHTTFKLTAKDVDFVLDFFSPVSPHDYVRQSMPYSYLTVSTSSAASGSPSVQIYSDIDNAWIGQFGTSAQNTYGWEAADRLTQVFSITPQGTAKFSEDRDMALWGSAVYCTRENASKLSRGVGIVDNVRESCVRNGTPGDLGTFKAGSVLAFSHDLGSLEGTENVTFVIGHVRDEAVDYLGKDRSGYFRSECKDFNCGCMHALDDFHSADKESRGLDAFIAASDVGSANYSNILALSTRQAFGTMDLTIPADTLDTNDVLAFVKEISSNGNTNTMDVIMPMAPILYVLAPDYIRLALQPVLSYLNSGSWPHDYTIHDMGSHYPNATGHNDGKAEEMPIEECGNLLALVYMYELATGDIEYKTKYLDLLTTYAEYLLNHGLYPVEQLSTDDGAGLAPNQTGLAIKAAIGLNAFGVMTNQRKYIDAGTRFADTLYDKRVGTDPDRSHFTLIEGEHDSWSTQFNLYLDVLLKLNTFPTSAYKMQTDFYPSVRRDAGVPLDNRDLWAKTDWMIFAAATAMAPGVDNEGVRDMFVNDVHAFMTNGKVEVPFSDKFWVDTGADGKGARQEAGLHIGYKARPVVGGHFALLALEGPDQVFGKKG